MNATSRHQKRLARIERSCVDQIEWGLFFFVKRCCEPNEVSNEQRGVARALIAQSSGSRGQDWPKFVSCTSLRFEAMQ